MKMLGSKLIDLGVGVVVGGEREKIELVMGNSKVYCGGHKPTAITKEKCR